MTDDGSQEMSEDAVPWDELPHSAKATFAHFCHWVVGVESIEHAEKYYQNREKLLTDIVDPEEVSEE